MSCRSLVLVLFASTVACSAVTSGDDVDASDDSVALTEGAPDGVDVEADDPGPERRLALARLIAEHTASTTNAGDVDADRDGDGIPDALEEDLLRRYRPFYRFSKTKAHGCLNPSADCPYHPAEDEQYRPADPIEELRHASLEQIKGNGGGASPIDCGASATTPLTPEQLFACRPDASVDVARRKTDYCLSIDPGRRSGVSFEEARTKAPGFYGHVAPDTVNGHPAYKVEYWQFFAFNNQDIQFFQQGSYGDHDGDWNSIQLWFDRTEHRLARIDYLVHGHVITFGVPAATSKPCKGCIIHMKGSHYDPLVGNFLDDGDRKKYDDNMADFMIDDHRYKHVIVYIEAGGHELWPGSWGSAAVDAWPLHVELNPHDVAGTSYMLPDVFDRPINLGEVDHPLFDDAATLLKYDGYWGCTNDGDVLGPVRRSPPGPAMHCSWKWPSKPQAEGCEQ